jgi:hypothetical protein
MHGPINVKNILFYYNSQLISYLNITAYNGVTDSGGHHFRPFLSSEILFCARFNFNNDHRQTSMFIWSKLKNPAEFREKNFLVKSTDLKRICYVERK